MVPASIPGYLLPGEVGGSRRGKGAAGSILTLPNVAAGRVERHRPKGGAGGGDPCGPTIACAAGSNPARYSQRTPRRAQVTCSPPRPQQSAAYACRSKATVRTARVTSCNPSGKRIRGDIPRASVTPRTLGSSLSEDRGPDLVSVLGGAPVFTLVPGQERNGILAHDCR